MSKTENGKFFIVVFQRFQKPKKAASGTSSSQPVNNTFDDITVKELSQVEAIQLLKRFGNDLQTFVN